MAAQSTCRHGRAGGGSSTHRREGCAHGVGRGLSYGRIWRSGAVCPPHPIESVRTGEFAGRAASGHRTHTVAHGSSSSSSYTAPTRSASRSRSIRYPRPQAFGRREARRAAPHHRRCAREPRPRPCPGRRDRRAGCQEIVCLCPTRRPPSRRSDSKWTDEQRAHSGRRVRRPAHRGSARRRFSTRGERRVRRGSRRAFSVVWATMARGLSTSTVVVSEGLGRSDVVIASYPSGRARRPNATRHYSAQYHP